MIEADLIVILNADVALTGLIGTRVYPLVLPQNATLPAATYQRISGIHEHQHASPSTLARPRFQFVAIAPTFLQARLVANAIKTALDARQHHPTIQAITVENEFDHYNPAQPDMAASWSSYLDLIIWHTLP